MLIEIWSDIACPFCYLGLTKLQQAIQNKGLENEVQIELRTFLLNPGLKTDLSKSISQYLHEHKQIPLEQIEAMNHSIVSQGQEYGLDFQMQQIKVANTIKAHLLLHEAHEQGLQWACKMRLLKAYFTEGKNIDDIHVLQALAQEIGMKTEHLDLAILGGKHSRAFTQDLQEAQELGLRGVPYFIFDRKVAIYGAREVEAFEQALLS
ncbi:MAG: DsbA family oxidoreductase [Crocinitomicaceae bacterium]|nr:DsbA family oxidoreductase [Crocinitomicaceae bacterium]